MRAFGIGFDLLSQLAHIDAQILRISQIVPQLAEQKLVGEHLAGMLNQHAQELVLLGRELYFLVAQLDDAPHEINRQITDTENRPLALGLQLVTKRCPHAREKLIHAEGLGHVVVGPEIERLDLAGFVTPARQHHDRHALVARPHHSQQIEPLHVGQPQIENDEVGFLPQKLERGFCVGGFEDVVALRAQTHAKKLADRRLVVDDENLGSGGAHAATSSCSARAGIGSLIVNTAPLRSVRFAAEIVPSMASTKPREIARPSPVPARTRSTLRAR